MTTPWPRIEALFFELLELPPDARAERLAALRASDTELGRELAALLAADAVPEDPFALPSAATTAEALAATARELPAQPVLEPRAGLAAGSWLLEEQIGTGGMGSVWSARRIESGFEQRAAVKLVHAESSARVLARFVQERRTLSRLEHPCIARLIDGGALGDGRPYLVMELVLGAPIDRWCDAARLGVRERLALFIEVCGAVEYAHRNLVVHRDLKPANVLVEGSGRPKLLDFGIAKLLEDDDTLQVRTQEHERLLTPRYASPEQVRGEPISTASDVYSLGVMLHELLTGISPYPAETVRAPELARAICERTPTRPSASATAGANADERARRRGTTPGALARALRGDLDSIVLAAMRKEPERRYASVERLADDLRRHLDGRPVAVKGDGLGYRARKLVARHRLAFGTAAVAAGLLVAAGIAIAVSARTAQSRLADVQRLSDLRQLEDLRAAADRLWPARPTTAPALQAWLDAARVICARRPEHEDALARLRARALPYGAEAAERDRGLHARAGELDAAQTRLASMRWRLEHGRGDLRGLDERIAQLEREIVELERATAERITWDFAAPADRWEHAELVQLLAELARFDAAGTGLVAEVEARAARAVGIGRLATETHAEAWRAASAAIRDPARSPRYAGLELAPQLGLVPLGPDPDSGLWEFAELNTGRVPERGADGRLAIDSETALVLVLLPAGSVRMGCSPPGASSSPEDEDPFARPDEQPVDEVVLAPYFLSKYEMTQGQWLRFTGANPSAMLAGQRHGPHTVDLRHPVEHMAWDEADATLQKLGLVLPTEAQWEYAARAGTRTPWWTGPDRDSLADAANIADAAAMRAGVPWPGVHDWPEYDDGHVVHAPVGTYRANPLGLHDTAGNVWEWCRDEYALYALPTEAESGLRLWKGGRERCGRGGSYLEAASSSRSAHRGHAVLGAREATIGVRPARVVE
ncbi:MAG: SUMF1/EgtB/PvdO family nonheme iron enzyme [Planctomycetes bacterium]|nr:SUMF1/EgtB/PvdO family nonheme iron enzyme [Planctomycetota bacterium]